MIAAMKAKDTSKLSVLRLLIAAINNMLIEKKIKADDASETDVITVIRKEVKKVLDTIDSCIVAKRNDLETAARAEYHILYTYLPLSLTEAELTTIAKNAIADVGATSKKQMSAVIKVANTYAAGRADGKELSNIVQKLLQ